MTHKKISKVWIYGMILFGVFLLGFIIRFAYHDISPPGFTADEAVFGYNAYSLLKTGKDEFGNTLPVALRAFGDYRPSLYSFLAVPLVYIFGLTEIATRFPSIIAGSLTIIVASLLAWQITKNKPASLITAIVVATSPSHILISRYSDLAPLSTLFLGTGALFFLTWKKRKQTFLIIFSSICFVLAAYSYHNARITGPLILMALTLLSINEIKSKIKQILIAGVVGMLLLTPLLTFIVKSPELAFRRGIYQSFINQKGYEIRLWELISNNPPQQNPLITRFFHNKPKSIITQFSINYLSHFSPRFLFLKGDQNERFQTPKSGVYNFALIFLIPVGFIYMLRKRKYTFIPFWFLISPLVSSLGIFTPNSLHTLDSIIPVSVLAGVGAVTLVERFPQKKKFSLIAILTSIYIFSLIRFFQGYFIVIPNRSELVWNWYPKMQELVKVINHKVPEQQITIVSGRNINEFILFYNKIDPSTYQQSVIISNIPDSNGFEAVEAFERFKFVSKLPNITANNISWIVFDKDSLPKKYIWNKTDCISDKTDNTKTFNQIKHIVVDNKGNELYYLLYIPPDQKQAISDYCQEITYEN